MPGSTGGGWKRNATASPRQPSTQPTSRRERNDEPLLGAAGLPVSAAATSIENMTAQPTDPEDAEIEETLAEYREWTAAGRPGAVSHEEAMAELLRGRE
jgi:hypothetical protein